MTRATEDVSWLRDLPYWLIFATIAIAPFPFGSVSPVAVAFLCCIAGAGVAGSLLRPPALPAPAVVGTAVLAIVLTYLAVVYLQNVERVPGDPLAHPIWRQTGDLLGEALGSRATIVRDQPYYALGAPLLALLMFVGGYICGSDELQTNRLLNVVAWSGVSYAIFGICFFAIEPTMVLWQEKLAYASSLTGTFTNRNTAAVYFGAIAIVWLTLAFHRMETGSGRRRRSRRPRSARSNWRKLRRLVLPMGLFLACVSALALTASRAGAACSFVGILIAFLITFRKTVTARTRRWLGWGGAGFAVLMIYQVFDSGVGERLQTEGAAGGGRSDVLFAVFRMIGDFPWLGTGLGTFRWSFTQYRPSTVSAWGVWDKAHNVPAEIAVEGGLVLAGVVVLAWLAALAVLALCAWRMSQVPLATRIALPVSLVAVLHSLVDFSLQIPAFALLVTALLGAGVAGALRTFKSPVIPINPELSASTEADRKALYPQA